jgi:tetratricopeptide (TPR) repeat protein
MNPEPSLQTALADALAHYNAGRHSDAEAACRRLLATPEGHGHPAVLQLLALLLHERGEHTAASAQIERCIAARPGHAAALLLAGRIRRALGDLAGAAEHFQQALKASPGAAEPAFLLGATLLDLRHPSAPVALRYLLELHPAHAAGWHHLALALKQGGDTAQALAASQRAHALAPDAADVAFHHGLLLRESGAPDDAAAALEQSARMQPSRAETWYHLGLARQDQRRHDLAVPAFRRALDCRPDYAEAAFNLAVALQETGDVDAAVHAYRAALRLRPADFGRIAQALTAGAHGRLWLNLEALRGYLSSPSGAAGDEDDSGAPSAAPAPGPCR